MENNTHIALEVRQKAVLHPNKDVINYRSKDKKWIPILWKDFVKSVEKLSKVLLTHHVNVQDNVAIFSENMPEWTITDLAILSIRGVSVPLYATGSKKDTEYILNETEASILFVGEQAQYDIAVELYKKSKHLKCIVAFKSDVILDEIVPSVHFSDFIEEPISEAIEKEYKNRLDSVKLTDLASLIYTSGTTGEPKGVMLSHQNFVSALEAHDKELNFSETDTSLSFLPLSHVFERSWVLVCLHRSIPIYFNQNPKEIAEVLKEVKPTIMCTVPRLYEKMYSKIKSKVYQSSIFKRILFKWALKIGGKYYNKYKRLEKQPPFFIRQQFKLADKLVLSKLRDLLGGRLRFTPCGGAPIATEVLQFFHSFGINVKCGYGLTETTATVTLFGDSLYEFPSAGKPIIGTQVKIGANNEIMVKGPGVMQGYYKKPKETAQVFQKEWFKTGDAGVLDPKGNLIITDRIKDLIKTSGGKYVAPQKIETTILNDVFIEQVAVIGEKRKFITALIVPCYECITSYAKEQKIKFLSIEELLENQQIVSFFKKRIEDLQKEFSVFEKIKKFRLLSKEFTIEAREITATLKLKRDIIAENYKLLIDAMYLETTK